MHEAAQAGHTSGHAAGSLVLIDWLWQWAREELRHCLQAHSSRWLTEKGLSA